MEIFIDEHDGGGIPEAEQRAAVQRSLSGRTPGRVLLIPPDFTRFYSGAGKLTNFYYHELCGGCPVDVLPALGTHRPMTEDECREMYGDIPFERFLVHDWRHDVVKIGEVPGEFLSQVSEGLWNEPVSVEINRLVMDERYDLIVSIGQVVPHEVVGMANHSKNLFVGVGGSEMINKSHMLGAVYGMERMMGRDHSPVREMFDYALEHFLRGRPIIFALTTATAPENKTILHGLYIGDTRAVLDRAVASAQEHNVNWLPGPIKKCVVYLDPHEFRSTWLGNKAVYRTRMAIADGGELLVLAPGVERFGEDGENDALIRKYGYRGRLKVLELFKRPECADLRENMGVAAHLIHGSSDGRFSVTYATEKLSREEVEGVGFGWTDCGAALARYSPEKLVYGDNTLPDGEKVFYIPNPSLGLWIDRERFNR